MGPFTALMTVDHAVADTAKPTAAGGWVATLIGRIRADMADRRLREQLSEMDNAMLQDIGIAADEIHMIRARNVFTPRAWAARGMAQPRWDV
jgi:uncharacterized protein YjiS (DUF1127 family)